MYTKKGVGAYSPLERSVKAYRRLSSVLRAVSPQYPCSFRDISIFRARKLHGSRALNRSNSLRENYFIAIGTGMTIFRAFSVQFPRHSIFRARQLRGNCTEAARQMALSSFRHKSVVTLMQ
jgi:hypothetical protein